MCLTAFLTVIRCACLFSQGVASRVTYSIDIKTHAPCLRLTGFYLISIPLSLPGIAFCIMIIGLVLALRHVFTPDKEDKESSEWENKGGHHV